LAHSKFKICSTALIKIGANPITDFEGETTESVVANELWETTIENWLSLYDWRFAMVMEQLSLDETEPLSGWSYSYQVPGEMLKIRRVHCNGSNIIYQRYQNKIYCDYSNDQEIYIDYTWAIETDYWPPFFRTLIEHELASLFAYTLGAQIKLSDAWKIERDRQFKLAKTADAQQQTAGRLNPRHGNTLIGRR
jgi:hypothetical protein